MAQGPTAPPSPVATPSPAPTPAWAASPAPAGWVYHRTTDPDLEIAVPGDWKGLPIVANDPAALASASPEAQKSMRWWDRMVAQGNIRFVIQGDVTTAAGGGYEGLIGLVEHGDASLAAFADRAVAETTDNFATIGLERSDVVLPSGKAVMLTYGIAGDASGSSLVEVDYLTWLPDGRSLSLLISKQLPGATVDGLRDLAESIATTLRPVAVTAAPSPNPQGVGVPDGWPIDLTLPSSWRWTWDVASYQAMLDGLDATRRAAAEQVGPPSAETWTFPYAVDTTSAPLPGGGLTMLTFFTVAAGQTPTIELLEAARRASVGQGLTLVGVERLELPGGPVVRTVLRMQRQAGDTATDVGIVGYETIVAGDLYGLSFVIPEQELESGIDALDSIIATLRIHPPSPTPLPAPTPTLGPADVHILVDTGVLTMKPAKVNAGSTVFEIDARAHIGYANGPMFFGPITDAQLKLLGSGDADWRGQYFHSDPGTIGEDWDLNPGIQQPSAVVLRPGRYVLLTLDHASNIEAYALLTVVP